MLVKGAPAVYVILAKKIAMTIIRTNLQMQIDHRSSALIRVVLIIVLLNIRTNTEGYALWRWLVIGLSPCGWFIKEINLNLARPPLESSGGLTELALISLIKCACGGQCWSNYTGTFSLLTNHCHPFENRVCTSTAFRLTMNRPVA